MSETNKKTSTTTTKKKKKVKKLKKHSILLWLGIIVAAIPCIIILNMIVQAILDTGKPVYGDRYKNQLNPAITETQVETIKTNINQIEGVEDSRIYLKTDASTLRIMVNINNDLSDEDATKIGKDAVDVVSKVLPFNTYFTDTASKKMYDLELYVLDEYATSEISPTINILYHKTGKMEEISCENLIVSRNPELVENLTKKDEENPEIKE